MLAVSNMPVVLKCLLTSDVNPYVIISKIFYLRAACKIIRD